MNKKFAYICSPYSGDTEANTQKAIQYCRKVYEAGFIPICPHIHFTRFLDEDRPRERKDGLEMALELVRRCSFLVVCGDAITEGMQCEILYAAKIGKITTTLDGLLAVRAITRRQDADAAC